MNAMTSAPLASVREPTSRETTAGHLREVCGQVLELCRRAGADEAQVGAHSSDGLQVGVRLDEVETLVRRRDRDLSVTVYIDGRRGEAGTGDLGTDSLRTTVEKACAIARRTGRDPCNGLADPSRHPHVFADLDLWHPWDLSPQQAIAVAREVEAAGRRRDARIANS
ncbi:MAG: metalloprotease PmbA, partial [Luteimonas sp.]|nr:metalloprotease PmbA [Luteimonas sp.]